MKERLWRTVAAVTVAGGLISGSTSSTEAKTFEKKSSNCKITNPHFKEISNTHIPGSDDEEIHRLKDCLGTILVCIKVYSGTKIEIPISCNWEDYNRRAQKKFAEANKPR